jgi:hypothetical protein
MVYLWHFDGIFASLICKSSKINLKHTEDVLLADLIAKADATKVTS